MISAVDGKVAVVLRIRCTKDGLQMRHVSSPYDISATLVVQKLSANMFEHTYV